MGSGSWHQCISVSWVLKHELSSIWLASSLYSVGHHLTLSSAWKQFPWLLYFPTLTKDTNNTALVWPPLSAFLGLGRDGHWAVRNCAGHSRMSAHGEAKVPWLRDCCYPRRGLHGKNSMHPSRLTRISSLWQCVFMLVRMFLFCDSVPML